MRRWYPLAITCVVACGGGDDGPPPSFPGDYLATFTEVRDCRFSLEHDLKNIRILTSPDGLESYQNRASPFPAGAIVLKEQYGEGDDTCTGPIIDFTVMVRLVTGTAPADLDWTWERVSADREIQPDNILRCTSCHAECAEQGFGFDGTCAEP